MIHHSESYDAIVIGSGFAGAVTACRLAEAGRTVCILERGRRFAARSDFPVYPEADGRSMPVDPPPGGRDVVQADVSRLVWKLGNGVWDLRDLGDVVVGQAAGFGGGSLIYANVHLRPPEHVFDERWPELYRGRTHLEPYFDLAAHALSVEPLPEDHAGLPKRTQLERVAEDRRYLRAFRPPLAINFSGRENPFGVKQHACDLAGNCCFGCPADSAREADPKQAKSTLDLNYLKRAEERGTTVVTLAEVVWIEQFEEEDHERRSLDGPARFRVRYRDHLAGPQLRECYARSVFLCAGAVNTTELVLRNRLAGKIRPEGSRFGKAFHPNQDSLGVVFDCDEPHELDRGPTITSSLLYDGEPDDRDPTARWSLPFRGAEREPKTDAAVRWEGGRARLATPARVQRGSFGERNAEGELVLADLEGELQADVELEVEVRKPREPNGEDPKRDVPKPEFEWKPFGRTSGRPRKMRQWFLVQDGGLPVALEPALGLFRSPLWLHRNGYRECLPNGQDAGVQQDAGDCAEPGNGHPEHAAASQRIGYAPLPFEALTDLLSGLTRTATQSASWTHEVGQLGLQLSRMHREPLDRGSAPLPCDEAEPRAWRLMPDQLERALREIHDRTLDDVGLAAEDIVGSFLDEAADEATPQLEAGLAGLGEGYAVQVRELELARRALRLGVQLLWGSQSGLARAIALRLFASAIPGPGRLVERAVDVLRYLLDYRLGDGRTAVLLSMGLDSLPGAFDLVLPREPQAGMVVRGHESEARGFVVHAEVTGGSRLAGNAEGDVFVAGVTGDFKPGEVLFAGEQRIGIFTDRRTVPPKKLKGPWEPLAEHVSALHYRPSEEAEAPPADPKGVLRAPLRVSLPPAVDTPERGVQERILRDLASVWGGELRTDPLWTFLRRRITVHAQGGCPMGPADEAVTDVEGGVHGCPGLYVMDAAAFPGPVGANPSATIAAIAEYKVEKYLERCFDEQVQRGEEGAEQRRADWIEARWEQRDVATRWVDPQRAELDPLGPAGVARPRATSETPSHEPLDLRFEEVMVGVINPLNGAEGPCRIRTELEGHIHDLSEFLARHARGSAVPIPVAGKIELCEPGRAEWRTLEIDPQPSYMQVMVDLGQDETGREIRTMRYYLVAAAQAGHPALVLDGTKTIRDDERVDVWEDTTTLEFDIDVDGMPRRDGKLRQPASEFFSRQLRSFRVNTDDPMRQAWALASFGRFFMGHLVDVYLPALDRLSELGAGLVDRGHA